MVTPDELQTSERRIVARLLAAKHAIVYAISHNLSARAFLDRNYQHVFDTIQTLHLANAPHWDYDAVKNRAKNLPWYPGDVWLGELALEGTNVDEEEFLFHVERIVSRHAVSKAQNVLVSYASKRDIADPVQELELLREVASHIMGVTAVRSSYVFTAQDLQIIGQQAYDEARANGSGIENEFELTGFRELDKIVCFPRGRVSVVAGRPSHGKTIFATEIALRAAKRYYAKRQGHVLFFSSEMNAREMTHRIVSNMAMVSRDVILGGTPAPEQIERIKRAHVNLGKLPLTLDTHESPDTRYLLGRSMEMAGKHDLKLILWDYVEYTGEMGDTKTLAIESAVRGCHAIAKKLDVPVVLISQLNRDTDKGADSIPSLSHLAWSDSLAKIPAVVLMVHHPWTAFRQSNQGAANPHEEKEYWIHIKKNTHGDIGRLKMTISRQTVSIHGLDESPYSQQEDLPF